MALLATPASAQYLYKYHTPDGQVHYSDRIPPERNRASRERLNAQGVVVDRVKKARSKEELEKERELKRLRAEQRRMKERFLAKRRAQDRILLRTFNSEKDITDRRDKREEGIQNLIQITQDNQLLLRKRLLGAQKSAAQYELNGQAVPANLLDELESIKAQIADNEAYIDAQRKEQEAVRDKFKANLTRFREIKEEQAKQVSEATREERPPGGEKKQVVLSVVNCPNRPSCNKAWSLAQLYARDKASTRIQLITDAIIMTDPPRKDSDHGITVSRIPGEGGSAQLFLDLECRSSAAGQRHCSSPSAQEIRRGFRPYIEQHLR